MSIKIELIDCAGKTDSHEHKSAVILKDRFERYFSRDEYSHIVGTVLIFSNVFIYGQAVKDIDIVCAGEFDNGFRLSQVYTSAKKIKGKNDISENIKDTEQSIKDDEFAYRDVYIENFIFCIEVKGHDIRNVFLDKTNLKVIYDRNNKHDATYQSQQQQLALRKYIISKSNSQKYRPWIYNFIWLTEVNKESLNNLLGNKEDFVKGKNILPSEFGLKYIFNLACIQNEPSYYENKPDYLKLRSLFKVGLNGSELVRIFKDFSHYKAGAGTLTRKKMDKITKRLMKEQNYVSAIGEKLVIIRGRAGTGKTFKLVRIAYELALHKNKRCLILTYNKALVGDIKRLLFHIGLEHEGLDDNVEISTLHSYIRDLIISLGLVEKKETEVYSPNDLDNNREKKEKKVLDDFLENYDEYLDEITEHIKVGSITHEDIKDLIKSREQSVLWDYLLIDESQDWDNKEINILYKLFGSKSVVISDGVDQMVRKSKRCDWKLNIPEFETTTERRSFRQKNNLVNFVNAFAEEYRLGWEVEPIKELLGGSIYISEIENDFELFKREKDKCLADNTAYDFMFLTPPSLVNSGDGFSLTKEYEGHNFKLWDGTDKDLRSTYSVDLESHRLLQYESCRGLEAWSVVCLALDDFVEHKIKYFKDEEIEQSFSFIQDKEENKRKHAYQWSLIPLTRPIDTLIITLKNPKSDFSKKLKTLADEHRDFVYWEN